MTFDQLCVTLESSGAHIQKWRGWEWHNWKEMLSPFFKSLRGMKRLHHFTFNANITGTVAYKEFADSTPKNFNLLKNEGFTFNHQTPKEIEARGLTEERRKYLFKEIRKYVDDEFEDDAYPLLVTGIVAIITRHPFVTALGIHHCWTSALGIQASNRRWTSTLDIQLSLGICYCAGYSIIVEHPIVTTLNIKWIFNCRGYSIVVL